MTVDTHEFKKAFLAGEREGFALLLESQRLPPPAQRPFLTRKYDNHHLCMFVFESEASAEEEKKIFPASSRVSIESVSREEIAAFAPIGYSGMSVLVFLRADDGAFALL
jgi:hypothetical protein